ncbi:MAG: DUF4056 domain-containing protein [Acidobacteria bacterium]|nr:DUF4056 domain-containing protein [Acidobacteriota bacterium]
MKKKITASFDDLIRHRYGLRGGTETGDTRHAEDLLAGSYGIRPAAKPPRGKTPTSAVLTYRCDDGETIPQRKGRPRPGALSLQQAVQPSPELPDIAAEYQVEIIDPVKDVVAGTATAAAPSVAAAPASPSRPAAMSLPAPASVPAAAQPATATSDDDFAADLQSILAGQKVFDPVSKTTVDKRESSAPPPSSPAPDAKNETAIFDRIAQSLQYANAYNLGTIELENRFADFDAFSELERKAAKAKKKTGNGSGAASAPPAVPPVDSADFIRDLDAIRSGYVQKTGVAIAGSPAAPAVSAAEARTEPLGTALQTPTTGAPAPAPPQPLPKPNTRFCCVFGQPNLQKAAMVPLIHGAGAGGIVEVNGLKFHDYENWFWTGETNGILYTCKGGFIDVGHVRDMADRTAYLAVQAHQMLPRGGVYLYQNQREGGTINVHFHAQNVKSGPAIEIPLAQRIAYELGLWHEIWSWCDADERYSAFSPEDLYSNLTGTLIAAQVLSQMSLGNFDLADYNKRMGSAVPSALALLGAVAAADTQAAMDVVDVHKNPAGPGWWDSTKTLTLPPDFIRKRHLGAFKEVRPVLVPGANVCGALAQPARWPVPEKDGHGTSLNFYYTLKVDVDTSVIPARFLPNPSSTQITSADFPAIVEKIRADVLSQFPYGDKP